jgi:hypothetical protein
MAKITNLGNETDLKWIHNVSEAVGPGCWNKRDDVLLVQHALNKLLPHLEILGADGKPITAYLKRDGWFGPKTQAAILGYQNNVRKRGGVITADGRISPANKSGWGPLTGNQFTIVHMNRDHRNIHGSMMQDSEFPPEVILALKMNPMDG